MLSFCFVQDSRPSYRSAQGTVGFLRLTSLRNSRDDKCSNSQDVIDHAVVTNSPKISVAWHNRTISVSWASCSRQVWVGRPRLLGAPSKCMLTPITHWFSTHSLKHSMLHLCSHFIGQTEPHDQTQLQNKWKCVGKKNKWFQSYRYSKKERTWDNCDQIKSLL